MLLETFAHFIIVIICFVVKQVFSDMDFLGWYTTGDQPDDMDIKIHKQICEINESPVLLKLNPQARHSDVSYEHTYATLS